MRNFPMFKFYLIVSVTAVYFKETVFFDFALNVNAPRAIQHGGPA